MHTFTAITFTLQAIVKREVAYNSTYDREDKNKVPLHNRESGICFFNVKKKI